MTQWDYVMLAYGLGIGGTLAIIAYSWSGLKRAERRLDDLKRK